ncbi:MAG TPA: serine hydrolase domain-containing protein [Pseudomonadales bacterium]|nr:serine hydrolase domain-containing protein [Pseudomonadales bacterium]
MRTAFAQNFHERGEVGAAVAVTVDGRFVVDLWGGWADEARTRAWQRDTLVNVFSVGKAVATVALLMLVERRQLDLDAPVARYWPEFGAHDKGGITVRTLLSHRAGLPAVRRLLPNFAMYDWALMTSALADEAPWWEPGRHHGYHVNTFGFLIGEIVRRVSGDRIGAFVRREIAGRLAADFHFGIGPAYDSRLADYLFTDELTLREPRPDDDESRRLLLHRVYLNPDGLSGMGTVNTREWRAAEMPSTNGHANARAVARVYSALACGGSVDGVQLLRPETITEAVTEAASGPDFVLRRASRFGLGFQLTQSDRPLGPNPHSFGHFGAGGSLGFADPDARLSFAYTMNRAGPRFRNPRVESLIDAVYGSL